MTAPTPRSPGKLIAMYGGSRSFAFAFFVLIILFSGVGGFLLWLIKQARTGALKFTGDITILEKASGALFAVAALALVIFVIVTRRRATFHLHEHAVRAVWRNREQVDFFDELEDVYVPSLRLFGYRTRPGTPWVIVDHRVRRWAELRQQVIAAQVTLRTPLLRFHLQQGGATAFRYFSIAGAAQQALLNPRNVNHPTQDLVVTGRVMSVAGKALPLAQLARVDRGGLPDTLTIRDVAGHVFHSLPAASLLSIELLQAVLEALRLSQQAAYAGAPA
jgi:hypothetical protein